MEKQVKTEELVNDIDQFKVFRRINNKAVSIIFSLNRESAVKIKIFDMFKSFSKTIPVKVLKKGLYEVKFFMEGKPKGAYFVKMVVAGFSVTKNLCIIK